MLNHERLQKLDDYLLECQANGVFPGAGYAVVSLDELHQRAIGWAQVEPVRRLLDTGAIFDLASLTKVVATTTAVLMLCERGEISLTARVQEILPAFRHREVTVLHLLTHSAGLPAEVKFYHVCHRPEEIWPIIYKMELIYSPGTRVVYSDLGFMLLGKIVEQVAGSLADFTCEKIFRPLGMDDTGFRPSPDKREWCVATEKQVERGVIIGQVHDGNAYFLGGVSGHAGLFSTVGDLAKFVRWLLAGGEWGPQLLKPESVAMLERCHTSGLNERRGLGWQLKTRGSSIGELASPNALYHTGFTGTSLLIDRKKGIGFILLTNRIHPSRQNTGLLTLRGKINDLALSAASDLCK